MSERRDSEGSPSLEGPGAGTANGFWRGRSPTLPSLMTSLRGYDRDWAAGAADAARAQLGARLGPFRAEPPAGRGRGAAWLPEHGRGGDAEPRTGARAAPPPLRIRSLGRGETGSAGGAAWGRGAPDGARTRWGRYLQRGFGAGTEETSAGTGQGHLGAVTAIHGFRETEKSRWSEASRAILQRVQAAAFGPGQTLLSSVHVLDLEARGYIKPHVDSIKFCGATIAGLSLLSPSVMRLVHTQEPGEWLELLLEPGSLYILRGSARYDFSHEILRDEESFFGERRIPRGRRISVICRSLPEGMGPGESGQPPPAC
ncbi:alpha-ketoglutarate-dependent dioxygenase alkB homolog 7, mitochondrial isoform X1 [Nomascus leucogenys]|nr:alpha-ketoglutarate-dependent dioxygenase alkB homolog 7, mitochondrial isoform X1 [Nomascus leucogenys]XP_030663580.1 alpha-ketoglutarate-dependent dioxygenase alkB homolog 7, mitochondrial isoform X1 [Nomascus leucogenys]